MNFSLDTTALHTLRDLVQLQAVRSAESLAYAFLDDKLDIKERLSYAGLHQAAQAIAVSLAAHVQPGDRVVLALRNGLDAVRLFWGCIEAGVIPVPAPAPDAKNARASESRLRGLASDAGAALCVASAEHLAAARAQVPDARWLSPEDLAGKDASGAPLQPAATTNVQGIAYLQYTSGSTSQPRGVEISHANVLAQCKALDDAMGGGLPNASSLIWLPWFHDYGLLHGLIQPVYLGAPAYLMPTERFLLSPLKWLEAIGRYQVTYSGAPNFAYRACVDALRRAPDWSADLRHWRFATCGAEPVRAATLEAFAQA
ncbi:MAG: non ribosomal peptide synthase, partial [Comamonadaceae bacterium]